MKIKFSDIVYKQSDNFINKDFWKWIIGNICVKILN